jgi:hypothetical protein
VRHLVSAIADFPTRDRARTLSGFVAIFQRYYYLSPSVFFCQIPNSLRDFTQAVALVDDRFYLSGLHELVHDDQVLFVRFRQKRDQFLAREPL